MATKERVQEAIKKLLPKIIEYNRRKRNEYIEISVDISRKHGTSDFIDLHSHMEKCHNFLADQDRAIQSLSDIELVQVGHALKVTADIISLDTSDIQEVLEFNTVQTDYVYNAKEEFKILWDKAQFFTRPIGSEVTIGPYEPHPQPPRRFDFSIASPEEQMEHLQIVYRMAEERTGRDKGNIARYLRGLRRDMKLAGLFSINRTFMNETLREFLNVNENGVDRYTWQDMQTSGWSETNSWGSRFHQNRADKTRVSVRFVHGQGVFEDILIYTRFNAKFTHTDGREAIFNHRREYVTELVDRGTYNYRNVIPNIFNFNDHIKYDVNPFKERFANEIDPNVENLCNGAMIEILRGSYYWRYQVYE